SVITDAAYAPNSNRLDTLGASDVLLDLAGNTLNQGDWTYSYTPHHRLSTATELATLKAGFAYNGLGQRVSKTTATATDDRHFLYGSDGSLRVESDGQGTILMEYFYLNEQLLAVFLPDDDGDGVACSVPFYHHTFSHFVHRTI
ncbi:MAG: hypothetical protein RQ736_10250, partial [Thiogranum sp.]|nr:hypothetical protein [Thiogranum sp.]